MPIPRLLTDLLQRIADNPAATEALGADQDELRIWLTCIPCTDDIMSRMADLLLQDGRQTRALEKLLTVLDSLMPGGTHISVNVDFIKEAMGEARRLVGPVPPTEADSEKPGPSIGQLMSMACRLDHGLLRAGYYDQLADRFVGANTPTHQQALFLAMSQARAMWEESHGQGFYHPSREDFYVSLYKSTPNG